MKQWDISQKMLPSFPSNNFPNSPAMYLIGIGQCMAGFPSSISLPNFEDLLSC